MVDLTQIELATEDDKTFGIDYWARLFKAETWEAIKMLAKDNEYLEAAANSLFEANADRMVRERCIARKEAERRERTLQRDIRLLKEENAKLSARVKEVSTLEARIKELEAKLAEKE